MLAGRFTLARRHHSRAGLHDEFPKVLDDIPGQARWRIRECPDLHSYRHS
jgi:hypothetical protein